jgi:hypothetical protein
MQLKIRRARTFRWFPAIWHELPGEVFFGWLWWRGYAYRTYRNERPWGH